MKKSKRFTALMEKIAVDDLEIGPAIEKIKETANAKFDESVEISIALGVDPVKSDQMVRGNVSLPNGIGKEVRVAVVAQEESDIKQALDAGAVYAGKDEILDKIKKEDFDFDVLIATPDCMKDLGKFGRSLGPKGLMPSPKSGTVTKDVANTVASIKKGQVEFKMDKYGVIHGIIGKVSFENEKLVENFEHYIDTVKKNRPATAKGKFIKKISLCSTMGPSVKIAV